MTPAVMGSASLSAADAIDAVDSELGGANPGKVVFCTQKPNRAILAKAQGFRQIPDFWRVQVARSKGCKLATNDAGILVNWPADSVGVAP